MIKTCLIISILSFWMISSTQQEKFPETEITNGLIRTRLYLPDSNKGYYQATRFDWSGIISSLEYEGHSFYGQWFEKYSPTTHDAIMGPVEEILRPLLKKHAGLMLSLSDAVSDAITRDHRIRWNRFSYSGLTRHNGIIANRNVSD